MKNDLSFHYYLKYKNFISSLISRHFLDLGRFLVKNNSYHKHADDIKCLCLFIGLPRSGTSLLGSLLDAHPNMMISHEFDIVKYIVMGLEKKTIVSAVCTNSTRISKNARTGGGYNNKVQTGWQGKFHSLNVIGDKKAAMTSLRLSENPVHVEKIRQRMGCDLKIIYLTRNPFDVITTMWKRNSQLRTLEKSLELYYYILKCTNKTIRLLRPNELIIIKLEDLILFPSENLYKLCSFLHEKANDRFIEECSKLMFSKPKRTYNHEDWPSATRAKVQKIIETDEILSSYDE